MYHILKICSSFFLQNHHQLHRKYINTLGYTIGSASSAIFGWSFGCISIYFHISQIV
jgi:hypothetical protein